MMRKRLYPMLALLAALSLVTAACGQKAGVSSLASGDGGGGDTAATEEGEGAIGEVTETGEVIIGYDEQGNAITAPAGSEAAKAATGAGPAGSTTRRPTGGATATTAAPTGAAPTSKVWGKTVTIGIHAPITGAAPLPSTFQAAAKFVKDYYNAKGGIHGRTIEIVIEDDQYQPAVATQRCSEMVKARNAFLLIGAAGTDQIQACARYAATAGVPYLSAGVTEKGLTSLKNYFAISMTYKQQVPYLVNYMKKTFGTKASNPAKVYMVYSDTPNFGDAVSAWKESFPGAKTIKVSRVPSQGELAAAARDLCTPGAEAELAFPLMAPKDWIVLLQAQTCSTIQWAGIGVTMGVNEVAKSGCRTAGEKFNNSTFFSPFPGIDKAAAMDPEFGSATQGKGPDDIWVALWGTTKGIVELLNRAGPDLTRAKFVTTAEAAKNLSTGLSPPLTYSPTNHFGADQTHVLKARCFGSKSPSGQWSEGIYDTPTTFAKF